MPIDFFMDETGDIQRSPSGDIALTPTGYRDVVQQVYLRIMTDQGDYLLYPTMGASLSKLYGMPQSAATGEYGINLIQSALTSDGRFPTNQITVKAVPIDWQTIRFDVFVSSGSLQLIKLSVQQNLGLVTS